jgi:hypothetical protein
MEEVDQSQPEQVKESIGQFMEQGYEGTIIRNFNGKEALVKFYKLAKEDVTRNLMELEECIKKLREARQQHE